ncbi:MAG: DUF7518 family protein [Methanomicrobiales archaeon]
MAQKDAKIKFLERELEEREREITAMKDRDAAGHEEGGGDRVSSLEAKVRELEATVKALTAEILDQKTVVDKLSRTAEARTPPPVRASHPTQAPRPQEPVEKKVPPPPSNRAAPSPRTAWAEDTEEDMDLIMQNDGTLQKERREKSDYIVASSGYGSTTRKQARRSGEILVADSARKQRGKGADNTEG